MTREYILKESLVRAYNLLYGDIDLLSHHDSITKVKKQGFYGEGKVFINT